MKILAIETSCDDTGIAILEIPKPKIQNPKFVVLSNIVSSQTEVHKKYGGVFPAMAKREHEKNLKPTLMAALKEAKILLKDINLIAVTNGPGLEPCLWVGVNFAKDLAQKLQVPIVAVNHIEAHILVNFLENKNIKFPAVALVVSGGHTQLILMKKIGNYEILGETRDDAAGECLDKCAKILGLGYPGGPIISKLAAQAVIPSLTGNPVNNNLDSRFHGNDIHLPRPMIFTKDYDFSFSGLKTAVLYAWRELSKNSEFFASRRKTHYLKIAFAKEIQQAIIDVLIKKTIKAVKDFRVKTIILGGGVSANQELRRQFSERVQGLGSRVQLLFPPAKLSTDNGLMVAVAGYFHRNKKIAPDKLEAKANLRIS